MGLTGAGGRGRGAIGPVLGPGDISLVQTLRDATPVRHRHLPTAVGPDDTRSRP